jgi:hypothetical protein
MEGDRREFKPMVLTAMRFFLDKIFTRRKFQIVKQKAHTPVPRAKPAVTPAK